MPKYLMTKEPVNIFAYYPISVSSWKTCRSQNSKHNSQFWALWLYFKTRDVSTYFNTTRATHNQRQKKQHYKQLRWCLQCTGVLCQLSSPSTSSRMDHIPGCWYANRTPRVGWVMSLVNTTQRLSYIQNWNVKLLGCVCRSLQLMCCIIWSPHLRFESQMARHFLDRQILDQQNVVLCQVSSWAGTWWTIISWEMPDEEGLGLRLGLWLVWVGDRVSVMACG